MEAVWDRDGRAKCPAEKHCSNSRGSGGYFIRFIITWGPEIGNRVELMRRDLSLEKCHIPMICLPQDPDTDGGWGMQYRRDNFR